jgi:hypothetical protein
MTLQVWGAAASSDIFPPGGQTLATGQAEQASLRLDGPAPHRCDFPPMGLPKKGCGEMPTEKELESHARLFRPGIPRQIPGQLESASMVRLIQPIFPATPYLRLKQTEPSSQ